MHRKSSLRDVHGLSQLLTLLYRVSRLKRRQKASRALERRHQWRSGRTTPADRRLLKLLSERRLQITKLFVRAETEDRRICSRCSSCTKS